MKVTAAHYRKLLSLSKDQLADLALVMGEKHPKTFLGLLQGGEKTYTFEVPFAHDLKVTFTEPQMRELRVFRESQHKVSCIKLVRQYTAIGLSEAKDLVESTAFIDSLHN
jgi:hypothetical protein